MSQENVELSRRGRADAMTAAANRRDPEAFAELADPEVEVRSVIGGVEGRVYTGAEGLSDWIEDLHATWDDYRAEIVEFREVADGRTVVVFHIRGRAKGSGVPLDGRIAHVWTWRNEKPWRSEAYTDPHEALEAVGLSE
jgi:ketosteroid isomerase-like protein